MPRRSPRLGSDEESDSSTVTNISYRESSVKVFKKKAAGRKPAGRATKKGKNTSPVREPPAIEGPIVAGSSSQSSTTSGSPRRPKTPPAPRSPTPTRRISRTPERSGGAGMPRPGGYAHRSYLKSTGRSGVESSGYSSYEGSYRRPLAVTTRSSSKKRNTFSSYIDKITKAFNRFLDGGSNSETARTCAVGLLLLLTLPCMWYFCPFLASLVPRMSFTKIPSLSRTSAPSQSPANPFTLPNLSFIQDSSAAYAAVETKIQQLLMELQSKQEQLVSQMTERQQVDTQVMKAKIEALECSIRHLVEEEVTKLTKQIEDFQAGGTYTAAGLSLKIQTLENKNDKLSQKLSSIQFAPPDPSQNQMTPELKEAIEKWFTDRMREHEVMSYANKGNCIECSRPVADMMPDFALETQGASIVSTRCSETYHIRSACMTLFGIPLWYPSESPRTIIQGYSVLLPGKCWAFQGVRGYVVIALSHPIKITYVTLDHLPRYNAPTGRIDSAPKDFQVFGMRQEADEGTLLGTFTYDENGEPSQTFKLPNRCDVTYQFVELRILSNWGNMEYTCIYRFRVHGNLVV